MVFRTTNTTYKWYETLISFLSPEKEALKAKVKNNPIGFLASPQAMNHISFVWRWVLHVS